MGYNWPEWALLSLVGIDPREVLQVLMGARRWPRQARGRNELAVLTVWGRTETGRPLIVAVRRTEGWQWDILGAVEMTEAQAAELERWEHADD
ncbi:hypothetical protein [Nocardia abscessus]|uniref:hypothetical protein n=1 Tax=Nocardia abscessus TaxID=120957 RepID=UPI002453C239|nr:hypothetical protein [Nocardia abscessus]